MLLVSKHRFKHLILLVSILAVAACGGNGSSGNQDLPSIEIPEIAQANPGDELEAVQIPEIAQANPGDELEAVQIPDSSTDSRPLPEPVATPDPSSDSHIAGLTVAGTEHFIASSLYHSADESLKAPIGRVVATLERDFDSDRFDPLSELFSVELIGDANWNQIPSYCEKSVSAVGSSNSVLESAIPGNSLVCSMNDFRGGTLPSSPSDTTRHWFEFLPLSAGNVKVKIVYPAGELPPGTRAATAEVEEFMDPEFFNGDLKLNLDELPTIFATEPTWVSFFIISKLGWEFETLLDVVLSPDVSLEDWKVERWIRNEYAEDGLSQQCHFAENNLHCELVDWVGTGTLKISLLVSAPSGSDHSFTASVPLHEDEQDASNNKLNVNFVSHVTTAALQELIDEATDGDTVVFPAGVYVGRLDGRGKKLNLVGAGMSTSAGASLAAIKSTKTALPTVIQLLEEPSSSSSDILFVGLAAESHVSGMELQTRGQNILQTGPAFTLSNSVFKPVAGYSHRLSAESISQSSCWLNNRIEEWGYGDGNHCDALILARGGPKTLAGNLFRNNNCRYGIVYSPQVRNNLPGHFFAVTGTSQPDYSSVSTSISVRNNTFINNSQIMGLYGDVGSRTMDFRNNLIFGTSVNNSESLDMPGNHELTSSSNLVWNSNRETLFHSDRFIVHAPDLNQDPMFNDPDNGDYSLRPESPAIDSGTMLADYDPNHPFTATMLSSSCAHLAKDGNFDGIVVPDIGALEYDPAE